MPRDGAFLHLLLSARRFGKHSMAPLSRGGLEPALTFADRGGCWLWSGPLWPPWTFPTWAFPLCLSPSLSHHTSHCLVAVTSGDTLPWWDAGWCLWVGGWVSLPVSLLCLHRRLAVSPRTPLSLSSAPPACLWTLCFPSQRSHGETPPFQICISHSLSFCLLGWDSINFEFGWTCSRNAGFPADAAREVGSWPTECGELSSRSMDLRSSSYNSRILQNCFFGQPAQ